MFPAGVFCLPRLRGNTRLMQVRAKDDDPQRLEGQLTILEAVEGILVTHTWPRPCLSSDHLLAKELRGPIPY